MPSVLIVAGEPSGDLHGGNLAEEIRRLAPHVSLFGVGGRRMEAAGVELLYTIDDLAVVGFVEVMQHLPSLTRALRNVVQTMRRRKPEVIVLIDFPGFNLRLSQAAHASGIRVIYYVTPQIWAWGRWRIKQIARCVDKVLCILPFEKRFYEGWSIDASFVGHPLLDVVNVKGEPEKIRRQLGLETGSPTLGLLPGSRAQEVQRILPLMLSCARQLRERIENVQFIIPVAEGIDSGRVNNLVRTSLPEAKVASGATYKAMVSSDVVLVASGTVTLEAAILEKPMVIVYRLSPLSWAIGKALVRVPHIGLVNIVAGGPVVPEFVQFGATPSKIVPVIESLLKNPAERAEMASRLADVRQSLGSVGASSRAAEEIVRTLNEKPR
jgi:lipid-A-disaccharide synthase